MKRLFNFIIFSAIACSCRAQSISQWQLTKDVPAVLQLRDRGGGWANVGTLDPSTHVFSLSQLPTINVLSYGADPTGAIDSCGAPLASALAAVPSAGGVLYWPRGTYLCGSQISVANKSISISGDGPGISNIKFNSASNGAAGISISQNNAAFTSDVHGLTVSTGVAQTSNAGIFISYSMAPNVDRTVTIDNVDINGGQSDWFYWKTGVGCHNCGYGVISNYNIRGKNEGNPPGGISGSNMQNGIALSGVSSDMRFPSGVVTFSFFGGYASGDSEGQHWSGVTMLAVNYGWLNDDYTNSGDPSSVAQAPGPQITNSHCAAYLGCIYSRGWAQIFATNNLFYKRPESTSNWYGVVLTSGTYQGSVTIGSTEAQINGNSFFGFHGNPGTWGLAMALFIDNASSNNIARGNQVVGVDNFATFSNGTEFNTIADNVAAPGGISGSWFLAPSPNSIAYNNLPINAGGSDIGSVTFAANATTPSVGGTVVSSFLTANSAATTITNFLNGYVGQTITIIANDANTTVQNNAGMALHSGANYVMASGNTLTLKRISATVWQEIGRS